MMEGDPKIIEEHFSDINSILSLAHEKVVYRFTGGWEGYGESLKGLFVASDQKLYFKGKIYRGDTFRPISEKWSRMAVAAKPRETQICYTVPFAAIPYTAIYELIQKKHEFIIKHTLDFKGGKYVGKREKVVIELHEGKEGKRKESKEELFKRADEINDYLRSKMKGGALPA